MTERTLIIGNKNYSSWSMRPWLLMKQANWSFNEIRIPLMTDEMPALMAQYSASRKVPVLKTEGSKEDGQQGQEIEIWDSLAICEYINECCEGQFWPEDSNLRAMGRSAVSEMHSGFFALRAELPMNMRKTFSGFTPSDAAQKEIDRISNLWQQLLTASGGPWLLGEFSIADAFYAPVVSRFITYQVDLPEACQAYCQQVEQLEAYQEWKAAACDEAEVIAVAEIDQD